MTKPNDVRPAKTQISLGILPVWSVFAFRMMKHWVLSDSLRAQLLGWSDFSLSAGHFVGFVVRRLTESELDILTTHAWKTSSLLYGSRLHMKHTFCWKTNGFPYSVIIVTLLGFLLNIIRNNSCTPVKEIRDFHMGWRPDRALVRQIGTDAWTKKWWERILFSRAGQCAALSWYRVGKIQILLKMVGFSGCNGKKH